MDNIHRWNWKVRKGEKSGAIKANDIKGILSITILSYSSSLNVS